MIDMKIYVVYTSEQYEGCDIPEAAFRSETEAKEYIAEQVEEKIRSGRCPEYDYVELNLPGRKKRS
jgi:hypothetical protein